MPDRTFFVRVDPDTNIRIIDLMKPVRFMGSAKQDLSAFPRSARVRAGHELFMVQVGRNPDDWRPMPTIGIGACEIRVRDEAKKTQKTARADLELARKRYRDARAIAGEE